jgi:hypothetical protein
MDDGRADAVVNAVAQIAPAESHCRDVDQDLVRTAFPQIESGDPCIAVRARRPPCSLA